MDAMTGASAPADDRAIRFTGNWREYLPIAVTNVLLTIVTLGIYRFWAAARQRRYLWSHTEVIDDSLEWTGTGRELFFGFLIVIAVLAPFFLFIQFLFPALIARGKADAAFGVIFLFEIGLLYLGGFARFRALRYRFSRTYWHGIRGGSNDSGWNYGGEYLGRYALTFMTMFIMFPVGRDAAVERALERDELRAAPVPRQPRCRGLKGRWALVYLAPIGLLLVALAATAMARHGAEWYEGRTRRPRRRARRCIRAFLCRHPADDAQLVCRLLSQRRRRDVARRSPVRIRGDDPAMARPVPRKSRSGRRHPRLRACLLGLSQLVVHGPPCRLYGTIDVSALTQSTTHAPREAEGFADAFDVGAI